MTIQKCRSGLAWRLRAGQCGREWNQWIGSTALGPVRTNGLAERSSQDALHRGGFVHREPPFPGIPAMQQLIGPLSAHHPRVAVIPIAEQQVTDFVGENP